MLACCGCLCNWDPSHGLRQERWEGRQKIQGEILSCETSGFFRFTKTYLWNISPNSLSCTVSSPAVTPLIPAVTPFIWMLGYTHPTSLYSENRPVFFFPLLREMWLRNNFQFYRVKRIRRKSACSLLPPSWFSSIKAIYGNIPFRVRETWQTSNRFIFFSCLSVYSKSYIYNPNLHFISICRFSNALFYYFQNTVCV